MKAYRASAPGHYSTYGDTPRQAAERFFAAFDNKRKCSVIEGTLERNFFVVKYGSLTNRAEWPQSWKDITKKTVATLPNEVKHETTEPEAVPHV